MPPDQIFVLALVVITMALFIWEKISPDLVSLGVLALLFIVPFNGKPILSEWNKDKSDYDVAKDLGKVFGNSAAITVACMFVIGAALDRTGMVERVGGWFQRLAGKGERRILAVLALLVVPSSAFLNNTTVVVLFLPLVVGLCRRLELAPSRFLIPLSYFAIVGGLCTLIGTSTNLVVGGIVRANNLTPLGFFEITPLGVAMALASVAFILLFGRKLLPERQSLAALVDPEVSREFVTAAIVSEDSPLAGKTFSQTPLAAIKGVRLLEVRRAGNRVEGDAKTIQFEPGDRVIFKTSPSSVRSLTQTEGFALADGTDLGLRYARTEKAVIMEGVIGPRSRFAGRTLRELGLGQQFGLFILAVHRNGANLNMDGAVEETPLEFGDTLLVEGAPERLKQLFQEKDFINLSQEPQAHRQHKAPHALFALGALVLLGAFEVLPFEVLALTCALFVVITHCLDGDEAYQSIEWKIIFMLFGTLGLGWAMDKSGAAHSIVHYLQHIVGSWSPALIVSSVLLLTIVLTELLSNNAVAALLTPLAIGLANELGLDSRPFIIAVLFGSSIGFAVPAGYQTHMLVYGAGGYKFKDFCRAGIVLDALLWLVGSLLIPVIWPLTK